MHLQACCVTFLLGFLGIYCQNIKAKLPVVGHLVVHHDGNLYMQRHLARKSNQGTVLQQFQHCSKSS